MREFEYCHITGPRIAHVENGLDRLNPVASETYPIVHAFDYIKFLVIFSNDFQYFENFIN